MTTAEVSAHARVSGTWEVCEVTFKHPSTSFWSDFNQPMQKSHAKVSGVWKVWATDLIRGLSTSSADRIRTDFDFSSPFFSEAGLKIMATGNVRGKDSGAPYANTSGQWLNYKNLHGLWHYGITITDDDSENLDINTGYVDSVEEEVIATDYIFQTTRTTVGEESGRFSCKFTDWDSPGPKQVHLDFRLVVSIENNPF